MRHKAHRRTARERCEREGGVARGCRRIPTPELLCDIRACGCSHDRCSEIRGHHERAQGNTQSRERVRTLVSRRLRIQWPKTEGSQTFAARVHTRGRIHCCGHIARNHAQTVKGLHASVKHAADDFHWLARVAHRSRARDVTIAGTMSHGDESDAVRHTPRLLGVAGRLTSGSRQSVVVERSVPVAIGKAEALNERKTACEGGCHQYARGNDRLRGRGWRRR